MSGKLTKPAFLGLIKENVEWLEANTEDCLERRHIIDILNDSVNTYYKPIRNMEDDYRHLIQ